MRAVDQKLMNDLVWPYGQGCVSQHLLSARAYILYEKRACNFHSDCTVGKILIVAKNSDKCVGVSTSYMPSSHRVYKSLLSDGWKYTHVS